MRQGFHVRQQHPLRFLAQSQPLSASDPPHSVDLIIQRRPSCEQRFMSIEPIVSRVLKSQSPGKAAASKAKRRLRDPEEKAWLSRRPKRSACLRQESNTACCFARARSRLVGTAMSVQSPALDQRDPRFATISECGRQQKSASGLTRKTFSLRLVKRGRQRGFLKRNSLKAVKLSN